MTVDISFGKLTTNELGNHWVEWLPLPPKADDSISPDLWESAGSPNARLTISEFAEWLESCLEAEALYSAFIAAPNQVVKLDQIVDLIAALPGTDSMNGEFAKWLKYWAKRTQEEFGGQAAVMLL